MSGKLKTFWCFETLTFFFDKIFPLFFTLSINIFLISVAHKMYVQTDSNRIIEQ